MKIKIYLSLALSIVLVFAIASCGVGQYPPSETNPAETIGNEDGIGDSMHISEEILSKVRRSDEDLVYRIYSGCYMDGFAKHLSIDSLLCDDDYTLETLYAVYSKGLHIKRIRDGEVNRLDLGSYGKSAKDFHSVVITNTEILFSNSVVTQDLGEIEVREVYCLSGTSCNDGEYIYFVTDKGDYVYFTTYYSSKQEYLFPVEEFYEFAERVYRYCRWHQSMVEAVDIENLYDLSEYRVEPTMYAKYITVKYEKYRN